MQVTIKVLLVDKDPLALRTFDMLLSDEKDIDVIGMFHNVNEAVNVFEQIMPDIMILDVRSVSKDDVTRIQRDNQKLKIVALINFDTTYEIGKVKNIGLSDYITKFGDIKDIAKIIRSFEFTSLVATF